MKIGNNGCSMLFAALLVLMCAGLLLTGCDQAPKDAKAPAKTEKSQPGPPLPPGSAPVPPGAKPMDMPNTPPPAPVPLDAPGMKPFQAPNAVPLPSGGEGLPGATQALPTTPPQPGGGQPFGQAPGMGAPAKP